MYMTTGRSSLNLMLLVCASLAMPEIARAQDSDRPVMLVPDPFSMPTLTLTSKVEVTQLPSMPQTIGELAQQLRAALESKDYTTALEYANVGLRTIPGNVELLTAKAVALTRLHRFPSAIAAAKDVLAVEPNNLDAAFSLAEILLITNRIDDYRALASKYKSQIDAASDGVLAMYFSVLEAYQTGDKNQLRGIVTQCLRALPSRTGTILRGWDLTDVHSEIAQQPDSPKRTMLITFIRVLEGEISTSQALTIIQNL
jgi:tetratricopeptide (TPR) repeat protein